MRVTWGKLREHRFATILGILVSTLLVMGGGSPDPTTCKQCTVNELNDCGCHDEADCVMMNCSDNGGFPFSNLPGTSPLAFEPNLGQPNLVEAGAPYDFVSYQGRSSIFLNGNAAVLKLPNGSVRASFLNSRSGLFPAPLDLQTERVNYLLGNKPELWVTNIPTYAKVRYANVYPGIDVVYYGAGSQLEHDFVVSPGTDPSVIQLKFHGADRVKLTGSGSIELTLGGQIVEWKKPVLYQSGATGRRTPVEGRYKLSSDGIAGFEIGVYDVTRPLIVDPVIAFTTYYGRGGSESAGRVATDAAGNSYIAGVTNDTAFGFTGGAFLGSNTLSAGSGDALITKISSDGKTVLYSTHIGGGGHELAVGIAVDSSGNIYFAGATNSNDYPLTTGNFQGQPNLADQGLTDPGSCFITKLNASGNAPIYSRLFGGSGLDVCFALAVDSSGNAYVAGGTSSRDLPTVAGFQPTSPARNTNSSISDGFAAKLSPDGRQVLYSTYIGGSVNEVALALALDSSGNAYITGATTSPDFPVTQGAFQTTYGGGTGPATTPDFNTGDAFVIKLGPAGARVWASYLGGPKDEMGLGIAVDAQGSAYVVGNTLSPTFPVLQALQKTYGGSAGETKFPSGDGFIAKFNPAGTALVYSSFLGGSSDDRALGVAVDSSGNAYVTGNTLSSDFPLSLDAPQKKYAGFTNTDGFYFGDAFFAQVGPSGTLVYSTYMGGSGNDFGIGVTVDSQGAIVVSGGTDSPNFPTTQGAAQPRFGGGDVNYLPAGDAFVARFGATPAVSISGIGNAASYASQAVSPGEIVVLAGVGIGPATLAGLQVSGGAVATTVAQTRILFDDVPAAIVYVSAGQSSAVVPYEVAARASTSVVVQYNGIRSAPVSIPVTATVPALFSADASGRGQGAILNQDNTPNSPANPALKGSIIVLYGTGEGQTTPAGITASIATTIFPKPVLPVSVQIGSTVISPLPYVGAAPTFLAGLLQINVAIPNDAPSGSVPVQVIVGGVASQTGLTVSVR